LTFAILASLALMVPVAAQQEEEPPPDPVSVMLVAVKATQQDHEERQFDKSIASIRDTVADLKKFDDFRKLRTAKTFAPYGKTTKIPLDKRYTLLLAPLGKASHKRIRCDVRVQMLLEDKDDKKREKADEEKEEPKYKEVLRCTLLAVSGKPFKIGGLKLEEGQLVLILTLTDPAFAEDE
jgi:hypothetical protein